MKVGDLTAANINDTEYYMRLNQLPEGHILRIIDKANTYELDIKKSPYTGQKCWYFKIRSVTHYERHTAITPLHGHFSVQVLVRHDTEIGVE